MEQGIWRAGKHSSHTWLDPWAPPQVLALCHIAVGQQMNLYWLHKVSGSCSTGEGGEAWKQRMAWAVPPLGHPYDCSSYSPVPLLCQTPSSPVGFHPFDPRSPLPHSTLQEQKTERLANMPKVSQRECKAQVSPAAMSSPTPALLGSPPSLLASVSSSDGA